MKARVKEFMENVVGNFGCADNLAMVASAEFDLFNADHDALPWLLAMARETFNAHWPASCR
jgi:hypothetical protein